MFSLQDAYEDITIEEIYSKVSESDLWRYYCTNFDEVNKPFKSDLYDDKNPSCRIRPSRTSGRLYTYRYFDYGAGTTYTIIEYLMTKFSCTFKEVLNIVAADFGLRRKDSSYYKPKLASLNEPVYTKTRSSIYPVRQSYNMIDLNYWGMFNIELSDLDAAEAYSAKEVYLTSSWGEFRYESTKKNPIYVYKEYDIDLKHVGWRVYMPYQEKGRRWLNNSSNEVIQGIKMLPDKGDLLILTKSLKDVLVLKKLGYNAISLGSETTNLSKDVYDKLSKRFKRIIVMYDLDTTGDKYSKIITDTYGLDRIFIPDGYDCKDISELIVKIGFNKCKQIMENLIDEQSNKG